MNDRITPMQLLLAEHDWPAVVEALEAYRDYLKENEPHAVQSIQALDEVLHEVPPEADDNG